MRYSQQITIIDYGVGNTHSVKNAINSLGYKVQITNDIDAILKADILLLPGVGAFDTAVKNLRGRGLEEPIRHFATNLKRPLLGICVGMQMLADYSEENGIHQGLALVPGKVAKLQLPPGFAVPHVGWNEISHNGQSSLFSRCGTSPHFYFDHSFHFIPGNNADVAGTASYGENIVAAVQRDNIYGVQFHPEKSQTNGLKMFRSLFSSIATDA